MSVSDDWLGATPAPMIQARTLALASAVVVAMMVAGWWVLRQQMEHEVRDFVREELQGRLDGVSEALYRWADHQQATALTWATDVRVVEHARALLSVRGELPSRGLLDHPAQAQLRELLRPVMAANGFRGFFVIRRDGLGLASSRDVDVGDPNLVSEQHAGVFRAVLEGAVALGPPQISDAPLPDVPTMFVMAPVLDREGAVEAVLSFRIDMSRNFLPLLDSMRWRDSGEVLVYDASGRLLNRSRFHDRLVASGQLGERWFGARRRALPERQEGHDLDGYAGHMGYPVVGAWRWLPELSFGVVVERAADEVRRGRALAMAVNVVPGLVLLLVGGLAGTLLWARGEALRAGTQVEVGRQRLRAVLDQAVDAIVGIDASASIVVFNDSAAALFGYAAEDIVGQPIERLVPERHREHHDAHTIDYIAGRAELRLPRPLHAEGRRADGSLFPASIGIGRVHLADGSRMGIAVVRDRSLELERRDLERSNRELAEFASIAAHDMQEPLRKVLVFSDLLRSEIDVPVGSDAAIALDQVCGSASRMRALVDDLLDFSQVGRHRAYTTVDLAAVVTCAAEQAGAEVSVGPLPVVFGAEEELLRVFVNLLSNAVKFVRPDVEPEIVVEAAESEGHRGLCVVVRDNGIGFAPEYAERIFDPFQRLHARDKYAGTGIGLAICRRIVEAHSGRIWARGVPGEGAAFYLLFPEPSEHPS